MHGFKGERVLMRIHIEEQDKYHGRPLYQCIVELLRKKHFAGATAFRGSLGFGAGGRVHTEHVMSIKQDLPIIVECIETEAHIQSVLGELDEMIGSGLITLERVRVIMYRHDVSQADRDESASIDVTGSWRTVSAETDRSDALRRDAPPAGPNAGGDEEGRADPGPDRRN